MTPTPDEIKAAREWIDHKFRGKTLTEDHPLHTIYALLDSAIQPTAVAPKGYVLVPLEPTMKMIEAGYGAIEDNFDEYDEDLGVVRSWKAMIQSAPPIEEAEGE